MAIAIAILAVLALAVLYYKRASVERVVYEETGWGAATEGFNSFAGHPPGERERQNDLIAQRVKPRGGGGGAQPVAPRSSATSTHGPYLSAEKVAGAEQQAWSPYTPGASTHFNPKMGSYAGKDATQHLGQHQSGSWSEELSHLAVDPQTRENHRQWANEVGPFSKGAMVVDNLDEAMAMSMHRHGINAFHARAPVQGPNAQQLTEIDANHVASHFSTFRF